ncbi:hypothetical protein EVAR_49289_1 [Eumeta japonica]|uniref:Uncharacterized protein n=1 Tax=Eumeta variegata TaxID=151549 RepID=A0A4C1XNB0_EUMVA|nr:hypothetical protein EVAR_49289_1 [Eumeta japonica]
MWQFGIKWKTSLSGNVLADEGPIWRPFCVNVPQFRPQRFRKRADDDVYEAIGFVGDQTPLKVDDITQIMTNGGEEELLDSDVQFSASDDSDNE